MTAPPLSDFATLDFNRPDRTGMGETVYCPGKTVDQTLAIFRAFRERNLAVLGTRCSPEQAAALLVDDPALIYHAAARTIHSALPVAKPVTGTVAVCTGGTADIPVAEEAAQTASFFGATVLCAFDVGVAGIHRLFDKLPAIREADVILAVAGMEGALASVVAGLTEVPVIAVPTSVGYGAAFDGLAPLLSMMNSCAEGVSVVNIDNGFGAAVQACRILRRIRRNP